MKVSRDYQVRLNTEESEEDVVFRKSSIDDTLVSETEPGLEKNFEYWVVWTCFLLMGCFNNFGYCVVLSAAKALADEFNQSQLIGVEAWALIVMGFIVKILNTAKGEGISHRVRGWIAGVGFFAGYALLSVSTFINFWFAIFAILIIGGSSSFCESVMLGYMKCFDSKLAATAFSSGTGVAGVAASGLYLLLDAVFGFSLLQIFIIMIPTSLFFVIALEVSWRSSLRRDVEYEDSDAYTVGSVGRGSIDFHPLLFATEVTDTDGVTSALVAANSSAPGMASSNSSLCPAAATGADIVPPAVGSADGYCVNDDTDTGVFVESDSDDSCEMEMGGGKGKPLVSFNERLKAVWSLTYFRCVCLALVYFFEYVCCVGLAQISNTGSSTNTQDRRYATLALCYQCGVLVSRSSLAVVNLSTKQWIAAMTALQAANFVLWHVHVAANLLSSPWLQYSAMVFVGLLGGCMYVNTVFSILSDDSLTNHRFGDQKELAVNVMTLLVTFGITMSTFYDILMDYTFFKHKNHLSS